MKSVNIRDNSTLYPILVYGVLVAEIHAHYQLLITECDIPPSTLKKALTSFLDLGSPLSPDRMIDWVQFCSDETEKEALIKLCEDNEAFQDWRSKRPNVLDLFVTFPSLKIPAASLVASLTKMMPRAYSIASIDPRYSLVGGQNIPVTDLLLEIAEFETGPFNGKYGSTV